MNNFTPTFQQLRTGMGYPDVPLPAERDWHNLPADYAPAEYTADSVKRHMPDWETPDLEIVWRRTVALSSGSELLRDAISGRPLNPAGPTGISGYGRLRFLGVNLTADGLVIFSGWYSDAEKTIFANWPKSQAAAATSGIIKDDEANNAS